jgi:profilin
MSLFSSSRAALPLLILCLQEYVDSHLVGTGAVKRAIIIGHDGSTWAATASFSIKPDEAKKIVNAFNDSSSALSSGITLAGVKYMTLKADNRSVYGKKGATGFCAVKTNQSVLIAFYDETIQPGNCASTVEKLADYLIENSY